MNKVGWIIFSAAVVLLLGGLVVYTRVTNPPLDVSSVDATKILPASEQSGNIADRVLGKADSTVILTEYGDFQCPGCGAAEPNVEQLMSEYGDRIALVFRNFPLTSIHPNARSAAAVAEAAGQQGKYWEMHNQLYSGQSEWESLDTSKRGEVFSKYAETIGLDMAKFNTDIASQSVNAKITFDQALGKKVEVSATPTFFLNGKKLSEETANGILQGDLTKVKAEIDTLLK